MSCKYLKSNFVLKHQLLNALNPIINKAGFVRDDPKLFYFNFFLPSCYKLKTTSNKDTPD